MRNVNDMVAVVESSNRVIDANRLRVTDASNFAMMPSGYPGSTFNTVCKLILRSLVLCVQALTSFRDGGRTNCTLLEAGVLNDSLLFY